MDPMLFEVANAGYSDGPAHESTIEDQMAYVNCIALESMIGDQMAYANGLALEVTSMDPRLFYAVTSGKADLLEPLNTDILQQVTLIKDTSIHIAAGFGNLDTIKSIHSRCPLLFTRANSAGDTTLHVAARAGHFEIVSYLIDCAKTYFSSDLRDLEIGQREATESSLIRKGNGKKDTVMHEAVRNCDLEMVKLLIKEDPELLCLNSYAGESPLHLAVEKGEVDIIKQILKAEHISYKGPNGRTALHAAIINKKPVIAKLLLKSKPELVKQADNNRRTPLHFASTLGFHELVAMLLEFDYSPAYSFDKDGSAPIHMSVHFGRIRVIKELLRYCPDLKDLVDIKGQNILHIAVECQQVGVIRYILQEKKLESLINGIDKDGNTPLHCASIKSYPYMVNLLVRDKRVDVSALNRKRLTALDIARMQSYESKEDHQQLAFATLLHFASSPCCSWRRVRMEMLHCGIYQRIMSIDWYKDKANTLLVVATLVTTVTFAAGFTMPGGYQSDDPRQGMPTLVKHKKFEEFVWWDAMAMFFSMVAVIFLVCVQFVRHLPPTFLLLHCSQVFTVLALECMAQAFVSGLNLTLVENRSLSENISRFGFTAYLIGLVSACQYFIPVMYIFPGYIRFRSWINQISGEVFRSFDKNKLGHRRDDMSFLFS